MYRDELSEVRCTADNTEIKIGGGVLEMNDPAATRERRDQSLPAAWPAGGGARRSISRTPIHWKTKRMLG